jgi:hypothetical protein
MNRIIAAVLIVVGAVLGAGCPKTTPKQPMVFNRVVNYQLQQLDSDIASYECSLDTHTLVVSAGNVVSVACPAGSAVDPVKARRIRDATIHNLIRIVDYNYFEFENDIYLRRASGSVLADIIDDSANFAATITNGERAKTIINAALIAFRSGRKSANLNFFREQTGEILITNMQTSRNRVLATILTQLRDQDVFDYSLEAALGDLIKYFFAGSLPRALQELQQNTSNTSQSVKQDVAAARAVIPFVTQDDRDASYAINIELTAMEPLIKAVGGPPPSITLRLQRIYFALLASKKFNTIIEQIKTGTAVPAAGYCAVAANGNKLTCVIDRLKQNQFDANTLYRVIGEVYARTDALELNRELLEVLKNNK